MRAGVLLLAMTLRALTVTGSQPRPCTTPVRTSGVHLFLEAVKPPVADTIVQVRLCLAPSKDGVGSYSAMLGFDSARMWASRVDVSGGMQAANANVAGTIRIAGAAPNGFQRGALATIAFRLRRGKALSPIQLTLLEANAPSGASTLAGARVDGYPSSDRSLGTVRNMPASATRQPPNRSAPPRIDSISPKTGQIDAESVLDLTIFGTGFAPTGNTVLFDGASVGDLASESGGTIVRFMAPTAIPARGGVQRHRVAPGTYDVRIRTPIGTSNAISFTVRGDDR